MRVFLLALAACAARVPQDRATGPDGYIEGAQRMTWATAERAEAHGVVTYPGGDRVDWWFVRLPDTHSDVEIEMSWKSPRPGLGLAFDVFGDDHGKLTNARRGVGKPVARASLTNVSGDIFIRVYARERSDAGRYSVVVTHKPVPPRIVDDWHAIVIPDPPTLPEVPAAPFDCTVANFDAKNVGCIKACPVNAPRDWPGCRDCPDPPDVSIAACWATMPCPKPPDERVRDCRTSSRPPPRTELVGRIVGLEVQGDHAMITVGMGRNAGVDPGGRALVVRESGAAVPGGEGQIVRVDERVTIVRVKLTKDQLQQTFWVRFEPTPKP